MTRMSGSVPLGRTRMRPSPSSDRSAVGDLVGQFGGDTRMTVGDLHVDQHLRVRRHHVAGQFGQRPAGVADVLGQAHSRQQTVAGRGQMAIDDVPALLAADRIVTGVERFEHGDDRRPGW